MGSFAMGCGLHVNMEVGVGKVIKDMLLDRLI
jgi:hypothetical protein